MRKRPHPKSEEKIISTRQKREPASAFEAYKNLEKIIPEELSHYISTFVVNCTNVSDSGRKCLLPINYEDEYGVKLNCDDYCIHNCPNWLNKLIKDPIPPYFILKMAHFRSIQIPTTNVTITIKSDFTCEHKLYKDFQVSFNIDVVNNKIHLEASDNKLNLRGKLEIEDEKDATRACEIFCHYWSIPKSMLIVSIEIPIEYRGRVEEFFNNVAEEEEHGNVGVQVLDVLFPFRWVFDFREWEYEIFDNAIYSFMENTKLYTPKIHVCEAWIENKLKET